MTCRDDYFVATAETQRKRAKQYETRNSRHWTRFEPGSREPSVMSCPAFFHAAARSWATCPVPRIPSFILFCSLSLCFCCSDEVIVAAGHVLDDSESFRSTASAATPEETFCWPVMRLPSSTKWGVHAGSVMTFAPARRRRSSSNQGAFPANVACV